MNAMRDVSIKDASQTQLLWFARNVMGLKIADKAASDDIRAKLREAGWEKPSISVRDDEPEPEADDEAPEAPAVVLTEAQAQRINEVSGVNDPVVTIFVPKQEGPGGDRAIPAGVNGTIILVPREQECKLAARYVKVLQDATTTVFSQNEDGDMIPRDVLQYPFNVIEGREHLR